MTRTFSKLMTTTITSAINDQRVDRSRLHWHKNAVFVAFLILLLQIFTTTKPVASLLFSTSSTTNEQQSIIDHFNENFAPDPANSKCRLEYAKSNSIFDDVLVDGNELLQLNTVYRSSFPSFFSSKFNSSSFFGLPMTWMNEQSSGIVKANHTLIDMPIPKYFHHNKAAEKRHESPPRTTPRNPVILIPGDGGSQLQGRLNRSSSVHYFCRLKTDWYALWLNLESLLPYSIDCFTDNVRFIVNETSQTYQNVPGVEIRVPGFGSTETVEWLDPRRVQPTHYFANIADYLVKANYTRNVTLRGTPYDFREGPFQDVWWYDAFRALVEDTFEQNNQSKVVLLAHSMGNLHTWYMLKDRTQEWKDKYIECFISLSAPWTGAAKAIRVSISGDNLGIFTIDSLAVRPAQRTWPSLYSLMPSPAAWNYSRVFVSIVDPQSKKIVRNYTLADMRQLFNDMEYPTAWPIYQQNGSPYWVTPSTPPRVKTYCLFGVGVPTEEHFVYTLNAFPNQQPIIGLGDGDGTVNRQSMELCESWSGTQTQSVSVERFKGAGHLSILSSPAVIASIGKILGFA